MCSNAELNRSIQNLTREVQSLRGRMDAYSETTSALQASFAMFRGTTCAAHQERLDKLETRERDLKQTVDRAVGKAAVWTAIAFMVVQVLAHLLVEGMGVDLIG